MGRRAYALSPEALAAAARWREEGAGYRDVASLLVRRHLVGTKADAATVRRKLFSAGLAKRQRLHAVRSRS